MSTYTALHVLCGALAIGLLMGSDMDTDLNLWTALLVLFGFIMLGPIALGFLIGAAYKRLYPPSTSTTTSATASDPASPLASSPSAQRSPTTDGNAQP